MEWWYRHRTDIEELNRNAKIGTALRHLPSGNINANAVGLVSESDGGALSRRLNLGPGELNERETLSRRLRVPSQADGVISQFEGYEDLKEFGWARYRALYGDIARLGLILQAEGDSTNSYKLSKQTGVLMLFYLLSTEEPGGVFEGLGYPMPPDLVPRTIRNFLARTSHGSTLSRLARSWVLARRDREQSWELFTQALECDVQDTQGAHTRRRPPRGHGRNIGHGAAVLRLCGDPRGHAPAASLAAA